MLAVDPSIRSIARARLLARMAGARRVEFALADAERLSPDDKFDLVFCNGMSHHVASRTGLLERLAEASAEGGWLIYQEISEGYAPMELERSIAARDALTTRERLRQAISGLAGHPRFRFFAAGTAQPLIRQLGFEVVEAETSSWRSLATVQRLWCRRTAAPLSASRPEGRGDYADLPPELAEVRERVRQALTTRASGKRDAEHAANAAWAASSENPLAPLILLVQMADLALPSLDGAASRAERLRDRTLGRVGVGSPDWTALSGLFGELEGILDRHPTSSSVDAD